MSIELNPSTSRRHPTADVTSTSEPLFRDSDWDFGLLDRIYDALHPIAIEELGLDIYPNQMEVIGSDQMLDLYTSTGMPQMYSHWSFGKQFVREEMLYRKGAQSLAYELVINSNPCVSYLMEENTATMQTLVIAHAAFGHNHFFKNNYLFQTWTDAESVLEEIAFAKRYTEDCVDRYGDVAVEAVLDAAHCLMDFGVSRYTKPSHTRDAIAQRQRDRRREIERTYDDIFERTRPDPHVPRSELTATRGPILPEENVLLFLARYAPKLETWQREILHIVRRISQYFYPQRQTKMMNEGCATYVHYRLMNRLYDLGYLTEGAMLEFLRSHTAVVAQPAFNDRAFGGINPYALGFEMMMDIERICEHPTEEDRQWFGDVAGCGDAMAVLREAWRDYRDESFIRQFLSPHLIRKLHLFAVADHSADRFVSVSAIHDEAGYRRIRSTLADMYDMGVRSPEIEVTGADLRGNRHLVLTHRVRQGRQLSEEDCSGVLAHMASLWGHRVKLIERTGPNAEDVLAKYEAVAAD